jgi:hypothetical protein
MNVRNNDLEFKVLAFKDPLQCTLKIVSQQKVWIFKVDLDIYILKVNFYEILFVCLRSVNF